MSPGQRHTDSGKPKSHDPDDSSNHHPGIVDESGDGSSDTENTDAKGGKGHSRKKIRIRKRIRIRKKPSNKKKLRKYAETAFWILIIGGFIIALIIMVMELDIRDDRLKKMKPKKTTRPSTY